MTLTVELRLSQDTHTVPTTRLQIYDPEFQISTLDRLMDQSVS